jgi:hypothetical protein
VIMHYNQLLVIISYSVNVFITSYDIVDSKNVSANVMDLIKMFLAPRHPKKTYLNYRIWSSNQEKRFLGATNPKRPNRVQKRLG